MLTLLLLLCADEIVVCNPNALQLASPMKTTIAIVVMDTLDNTMAPKPMQSTVDKIRMCSVVIYRLCFDLLIKICLYLAMIGCSIAYDTQTFFCWKLNTE